MSRRGRSPHRARFLLLAGFAFSACGGDSPAAPPAPPPVTVSLATLQPAPVDDATEYVATLKSLRSTEVRPQVEGIITRIDARAGQPVRAGAPLVRVDARRQQALVSSQDASRAALEADLALARTELTRAQALVKGGALSQQELDQAEARVKRLEAQLAAQAAQVQEARVQLQYFDVVAPVAGIVGDIPVRVGNRVTPADVLTTIEANTLLEIQVNVPLERAAGLKPGVPIQILGADGKPITETTVTFIAPNVDPATQTVLVEGTLSGDAGLRTMQYVRARLIWSRADRLVIPVVAVQRINGQYFAFIAESQQDKLVARQKPVTLGPIQGNHYVVLGGLEAGQRVVVAGAQKLIDGAPIAAGA